MIPTFEYENYYYRLEKSIIPIFMINTPYQIKQEAFTLIELVVSITILSVVLLSIFMIYSNLIQVNRRLEVIRIVQENIRNVTEQMASDIREK